MFGHFLGLAHDEIRPFDVRSEPAVSFTDDVASGFLLEAFATLARGWSADRANGAVSVGRLLDAVAADLAADGLFDGRGDRGQPIVLAGRELDSMVLRSDLGRALLTFAESPDNVTTFSRADLLPAAEALATSRSPLFPDGETESLDDEGPSLRALVLLARWRTDSRGVSRFAASSTWRWSSRTRVVWRGRFFRGGREAIDRSAARLRFDTTLAPEGPQSAELVAVDDNGNDSRMVITFDVDNTPPDARREPDRSDHRDRGDRCGNGEDDRGTVSEVVGDHR